MHRERRPARIRPPVPRGAAGGPSAACRPMRPSAQATHRGGPRTGPERGRRRPGGRSAPWLAARPPTPRWRPGRRSNSKSAGTTTRDRDVSAWRRKGAQIRHPPSTRFQQSGQQAEPHPGQSRNAARAPTKSSRSRPQRSQNWIPRSTVHSTPGALPRRMRHASTIAPRRAAPDTTVVPRRRGVGLVRCAGAPNRPPASGWGTVAAARGSRQPRLVPRHRAGSSPRRLRVPRHPRRLVPASASRATPSAPARPRVGFACHAILSAWRRRGAVLPARALRPTRRSCRRRAVLAPPLDAKQKGLRRTRCAPRWAPRWAPMGPDGRDWRPDGRPVGRDVPPDWRPDGRPDRRPDRRPTGSRGNGADA